MCQYTCGVFNHPTSRTARRASRLLSGCVIPVAAYSKVTPAATGSKPLATGCGDLVQAAIA
jgi:hypothetical protein